MLLTIKDLNKTYKNGVKALNNINLDVKAGMFGLLGPNGAGKSTMMRTIATLQEPDSGAIHFNDINILEDNFALRKILGYLPQEFGVYPKVSAYKLLDYFACLKGVSSKKDRSKLVEYVLDITNLRKVAKRHVSAYSGGMKQRFGIAQILLNDPKLIIVDEPTAGLDPSERKRFLNVLREISLGNIVIFSTHIVEDVAELCTDMAIMNQGKILLRKAPQDAEASLAGKIWVTTVSGETEGLEDQYKIISSSYNADSTLNLKVYAEEKPGDLFKPSAPNLEDVYFFHLNRLGEDKEVEQSD